MGKSSQSGIQEMANQLEIRKNIKHHTVLLLGARTGQLFRSADFYDKLQPLSKRNFHQLSTIRQFRECYTILTEEKFSEMELHHILRMSLRGPKVSPADINLALLIKNHYFDEIISTNIDDALEEALWQIDLKATRDYEVIRTGHSIGRNAPSHEKSHPFRITKPYGDFALEYIVRGRSSHLENPGLKNFLQNLLGKDLLIVGIDPAWDQDILRLIPVNTKATIWFVNEDNDIVSKSPFLFDVLRARLAKSILGPWGSYDRFVRKLYECLYGNVSPNETSAHEQTLQNIQNQFDRMAGSVTGIEMQIKDLIELLLVTQDRLQGLQNDHQAILSEMQQIRNRLDELEK